MLGMHGTYEANMTMHYSDVIFAVGVRFDDRTTNNLAKYCPNATVLHIDIDPTSISKRCQLMCLSSAMPGRYWSKCWIC